MSKPKPASADELARRSRAEQLLGDLLPDQTADDTDKSWGEQDAAESRDEDIQRNVPPHHGT